MKIMPHLVLYDAECPFCTSQMRLLKKLDWFDLLEPVPLSDPRVKVVAPQLSLEALREAIHCITPGGRIYRGARAFRFLGLRLPFLFPVALALWMPGAIQLAELVYRWASRNRYRISCLLGCQNACHLLPERQRKFRDSP